MTDWTKLIESREPDIQFENETGKKSTKRGQSTFKQELSKITDYGELMSLLDFLMAQFKKDIDKAFKKSNKSAGIRARNYAQRIKETMTQIRITIQNK